jgi:hypothetical protein
MQYMQGLGEIVGNDVATGRYAKDQEQKRVKSETAGKKDMLYPAAKRGVVAALESLQGHSD